MYRIRFIKDSGCMVFLINNTTEFHYYNIMIKPFINCFLPFITNYEIVDETHKADICIFGIQLNDLTKLRSNEINILFCTENCNKWTHYSHYNLFGNFGNTLVNIYIYNHINEFIYGSNYIAIPIVYLFCKYFNDNYSVVSKRYGIPFKSKKFCLFISRNKLNNSKKELFNIMNKLQLGKIDYIEKYDDLIKHASCYWSDELLRIFNKYKFIVCIENSIDIGYITEKIFNVFFSNSIPIYSGSPSISQYINDKCYINYSNNESLIKKVIKLSSKEQYYIKTLNRNKIRSNIIDIFNSNIQNIRLK